MNLEELEELSRQELIDELKRHVALYDFAPIAYFTFDPDGVVLEANLAAAALVGCERSFIIGKPFPALVGLADGAAFWDHLRRCAREGRAAVAELRFTVAADRVRDVQAVSVPVVDSTGRPIAFRTSFTDITQLKLVEAELAQARADEERLHDRFEQLDRAGLEFAELLARVDGRETATFEVFQTIAEHARSIVHAEYVAIGIDGNHDRPFDPWVFTGIEPSVAAAIGHTPRARGLLGAVMCAGAMLRVRDLREHPEFAGFPPNHPEMRSFLGAPIRFGGVVMGHLYLTNKIGADEFSADDQAIVELFATRAGVAIELARLARDLHASIAARDNLLAIVSHDLKGPLSTIELAAELIKSAIEDKAPHRRPLEIVFRAAKRMRELVEDLLQAATIEAGAFTVVPELHDVARIVAPVLEMYELRAAERSICIEREIPVGLPRVWCDEVRVVQVLSNLLGNAIKFAREHGRIDVRVRATASELLVSVTDDGPGIAPDQLAHVFERYWTATKERHRGVGLGLYIARGIVDAHHGRLWVDSQLGAGSTFTFALPLARDA
jgi:PAS domain S-box-containing protein